MADAAPSGTILLVEDEVIIALARALGLRRLGYRVLVAYNGEAAVRIALGAEIPGLILMDIDLGQGIDGAEAARRILARRRVPILFLSSRNQDEYVDRIGKIDYCDYVVKSSTDCALHAALKAAIGEPSPARAEVRRNLPSEALTSIL
ncbi:MAG: response regulator [Treponema sp.]|nr:response regulator [Treponema sp.]